MRKSKKRGKVFYASLVFAAILLLGASLFFFMDEGNGGSMFDRTIENYSCSDCNLIMISLTNVRADHLGYDGYFRDTSPNIDKLAAQGVIFDNAFSHASWTLPAGISLFTSTYPFTHGIMNRNRGSNLSADIVSLPDILEKHGYSTAAFTGGFDYSDRFGLTPRFEYVSYPLQHNRSTSRSYGNFDDNSENVLNWLRSNKDEKFFLFYQGFNAHCPFVKPKKNNVFDSDYKGSINFSDCLWTFDRTEPITINNKTFYTVKIGFRGSENAPVSARIDEQDIHHMVALYDGEIQLVDTLLKTLFDEIIALNLTGNTIIVVLSEHGDMFGKHGRFMRGGPLRGTFYDDVLHVPLIIKHPTLKPRRVSGLVQLIDVVPTLLDFLGIPKDESFEGKSLTPLIMNNQELNRFILAGSMFTPTISNEFFNKSSIVRVARTKDFKLINEQILYNNGSVEIDSYEFYDLREDPEELMNIYSTTSSDILDRFKRKLERMKVN